MTIIVALLSVCSFVFLYIVLRVERKQKVIIRELHKNMFLYNFTIRWLQEYAYGKRVSEYLLSHSCYKVAVYGIGDMGLQLIRELKDSSVKIVCAIDKSKRSFCENIPIVTLEDSVLNDVDVLIVTAIFDYEEIRQNVSSSISCKIISLEDIINQY